MQKHLTLLMLLLISNLSFSQNLNESNILGIWKIESVKIPARDGDNNETAQLLINSFTGATFSFKGNHIFHINFKEKLDQRLQELNNMDGDNWKIENEEILIGTNSNSYATMHITIEKEGKDTYFILPMIRFKMKKIQDLQWQPFEKSKNEVITANDANTTTVTPKVVEINLEDIMPFNKVDTPPLAPECAAKGNPKKQRQCTSSYITKHVNRKFNTELASKEGESQVNMYAKFTITDTGEIINISVRGSSKNLNDHLKEVIAKLPQMTPAVHNGKKVAVAYVLPVRFRMV